MSYIYIYIYTSVHFRVSCDAIAADVIPSAAPKGVGENG